MLSEFRLPPSFLGQAVAAYVHIWNQCTTSSLMSKTPYELWHRKKPDVSHLQVWGCTAYVHVQKDKCTGIGLIWRNVFLLVTQMATKDGHSIIPPPSELQSQNMLSLMKDTFLVSNTLLSHPNHLSHLLTFRLILYRI